MIFDYNFSNLIFYDYFLKENSILILLYFQFFFLIVIISGIIVGPAFFESSFAQQDMSVHKQWKKLVDLDMLTCKSGYLLLQKTNDNPACVMPSTYLELIDRGYGSHNQSIMNKNPEMMNSLVNSMASNEKLMTHWHTMMQKNSNTMENTMNSWISQMKDDPELLKNMLGPMTSDPELREKMIHIMKNHSQMENHLKMNSVWMDSVHKPMMDSTMDQKMHYTTCTWCPDYAHYSPNLHSMMKMSGSNNLMDMIHHVWINSEMTEDIHSMMLEDPSHMAMMSNQLMEPMLNAIMNDEDLREQMIDLMLEHEEFMNTLRHDNHEIQH